MSIWKAFWNDEEGMGTVEMVLLIAALVAIAIIAGTMLRNVVNSGTDAVGSKANQGVENLLQTD